MYYPYFRGKQYELITIREMARVLRESEFCPIIEPVRESLGGLSKALDTVVEEGGRAIVIVNPYHGDLSGASEPLTHLLKDKFLDLPGIAAGILLRQETTVDQAAAFYELHRQHRPVIIHGGFTEPKALAEKLGPSTPDQLHIFLAKFCGKLYQKHFKGGCRVLIKDGFEKKRNRDYELIEPFSDLHATFQEEGMDGFGDFLTVGDDYSESGGPAYAVAIHLTFIDADQDDAMQIYHFVSERKDTPIVSERKDTPKDPAGKFAEALAKMIETLELPNSKVIDSKSVQEFRVLHGKGHFPGLGYVKKLSMNHHIETIADYCKGMK